MAIEFDCPFCTSTIRVPDDAAGKKGTCPRCETPILVPVVEIPPAAPQESAPDESIAQSEHEPPPLPPTPSAPAEPPPEFGGGIDASEPVFPGPPTPAGSEFPAFDPSVAATPPEPAPSYAHALKRRRKRGGLGIVVPLLFGLPLLGLVAWFFLQSRPTLEGELTAEALPDFENAAGAVGKSDVADLPKAALRFVIDDLRENPLRLTSGLMATEFRGARGGIDVRVFKGSETSFFRVAPREIRDFNDWVARQADLLEKPRLKEFRTAVRKFFSEYDETEGNIADPAGYRDSLGLSATTSRVGYHMAAVADGRLYRCVYEDADHRLYFLLPKETRKFKLIGRKIDNGEPLFPGRYEVTVE